jgi:branched-chain amino acid transport system permease protein
MKTHEKQGREVPVTNSGEMHATQLVISTGTEMRSLLIGAGLALASLVVGLAIPALGVPSYQMTILVDAALLSIVAISIGFLYRHLGLISLGQTAFYGSGAYVTAILNAKAGWGLLPAAIVGVLAGAALAAIVGVLVMRATGVAFLMLTMVFGLAIYQIVVMEKMRPITGGYDGLVLMPEPDSHFLWLNTTDVMDDTAFWPLVWVVLVLVAFVLWLVGRSYFGTVLHGIRENAERMRFSGFGIALPRFLAFVIAGTVSSIAGVLTALNGGLVTDQLLSFATAGQQLVATIVGGLSTVLGPIVGGFLYTYLQSLFSDVGGLDFYLGLTLVLVLAFLRGGITGGIALLIKQLKARRVTGGSK